MELHSFILYHNLYNDKANKATTLSGYSITDAASSSHTHTWSQISNIYCRRMTGTASNGVIGSLTVPSGFATGFCLVTMDYSSANGLMYPIVTAPSSGKYYIYLRGCSSENQIGTVSGTIVGAYIPNGAFGWTEFWYK